MRCMSCSGRTAVFMSSVPRGSGEGWCVSHVSVGNEVPVGQVSYADNRPIQSIEYRSSGVILDVKPQIRTDNIDLVIKQQLSSFAKTDTGVNNSPTLIKREVNTEVSAADGDIILLVAWLNLRSRTPIPDSVSCRKAGSPVRPTRRTRRISSSCYRRKKSGAPAPRTHRVPTRSAR
ncbi:hypothetical protein [Citrobacter koseri]|uniref:hypothetical protein n=1 Tax=Citrobacter koseri TaxID=545 RepID=UPI002AB0C4DF|nr:hypothetical protein [Citrobacter koseri]